MASADDVSQQLAFTCKSEFPEYVCSETSECWALLSTQAPPYVDDDSKERAPLDLVAVVDKSGSMEGGKIKMVRETLKFVVEQMSPADRFGLVLYDSNVYKIGDGLVRMDAAGKARMLDEVKRIRTGSCTNLSGGLVSGMEMIEKIQASSGKKNEVASVLLMTDGEANEGYTATSEIIKCLTVEGRASLGIAGSGIAPRSRRMQRGGPPPQSAPQPGLFSRLGSMFSSSSNTSNASPAPPPMQQQQQQAFSPPPMLQQQQQQAFSPPPMQQQQQAPPSASPPSSMPGVHLTVEDLNLSPTPPNPPKAEGNLAATVYTFGFGADHNADLLQAVSEAGNGMYYFIDSAEKIPESFADCLGGLLSTVAQNISLEVKTTNEVSVASAFSGRDKKSSASGATCTLPLGDIQSEERRDVLLKLNLPKLDSEVTDWHVLTAKLSYFNVITSTMETREVQLRLSRPSTKRTDLESDDDVDTHKNRIMAAEAMQQAMVHAERGDMIQAQGLLQSAQDRIISSKSAASPICADMLSDMMDAQRDMSASGWSSGGKHKLKGKMQKHMVQRSNVSEDNAYTTKARHAKKSAFH